MVEAVSTVLLGMRLWESERVEIGVGAVAAAVTWVVTVGVDIVVGFVLFEVEVEVAAEVSELVEAVGSAV